MSLEEKKTLQDEMVTKHLQNKNKKRIVLVNCQTKTQFMKRKEEENHLVI